jgi:cobalt/nickel transport system permease protein
MIYIDKYAYISKLREEDPALKCLFAVATLGVCLWADSILMSLFIVSFMGWAAIRKGGIPPFFYGKLMLVPMSFLVLGVLTIAVNIAAKPEGFLLSFTVSGVTVGLSVTGLQKAVSLFFKSLGSVSCLYFLSLTTPMVELLPVLRKLKVPKLMVELMGLVYRFIFVLMDIADAMYTAQSSRLGYTNVASGYRSLSGIASSLFIRSYKRAHDLYSALEARGYDGEINVLEQHYRPVPWKYAAVIFYECALVAAAVMLHHYRGAA